MAGNDLAFWEKIISDGTDGLLGLLVGHLLGGGGGGEHELARIGAHGLQRATPMTSDDAQHAGANQLATSLHFRATNLQHPER